MEERYKGTHRAESNSWKITAGTASRRRGSKLKAGGRVTWLQGVRCTSHILGLSLRKTLKKKRKEAVKRVYKTARAINTFIV